MEFIRLGSSIPGTYWGCCCMDVIQNFKMDPDAPYGIQLVSGDSGAPVGGEKSFIGETYKEVFLQRLRIGTFNDTEMSNHGFLAALTDSQINGGHGLAWLKILRENGFEFIRTIDNSVYTGNTISEDGKSSGYSHKNYLFGLFRNINVALVEDPFTPPKAWSDLPKVVPELNDYLNDDLRKDYQRGQFLFHKEWWKDGIGALKKVTRKSLESKGIKVHLAGLRSPNPQEPAEAREKRMNEARKKVKAATEAPKAFPAYANPGPDAW